MVVAERQGNEVVDFAGNRYPNPITISPLFYTTARYIPSDRYSTFSNFWLSGRSERMHNEISTARNRIRRSSLTPAGTAQDFAALFCGQMCIVPSHCTCQVSESWSHTVESISLGHPLYDRFSPPCSSVARKYVAPPVLLDERLSDVTDKSFLIRPMLDCPRDAKLSLLELPF